MELKGVRKFEDFVGVATQHADFKHFVRTLIVLLLR